MQEVINRVELLSMKLTQQRRNGETRRCEKRSGSGSREAETEREIFEIHKIKTRNKSQITKVKLSYRKLA